MKVELIEPALQSWRHSSRLKAGHAGLTLPTVAALTPPDVEVVITDERVEDINLETDADLIGITTATIYRDYQIADEFRKRGKPVVLGGFHATVLPQEAIQHADAVVIGEAEGVWEELLKDFRTGKLKRFYRSEELPSLDGLPLPRRDLLKRERYLSVNTIQTSRGCPYSCDFCVVPQASRRVFRTRPVKDVIDEVAMLGGPDLYIVDNNIIGKPEHAKKLFRALIPFKKKWAAQATIRIANDDALLRLAADSGCRQLLIGFESILQESLREVGKNHNLVKGYQEGIRKIHDYGIMISGCFIFGFDNDHTGIFEETLEFLVRNKLDLISCSPLHPAPGTPLYERMRKAGRLCKEEYWLAKPYDWLDVWMEPQGFTREDLQNGIVWLQRSFYSWRCILSRLGAHHLRSPLLLVGYLGSNFMQRKQLSSLKLPGYNPMDREVQQYATDKAGP